MPIDYAFPKIQAHGSKDKDNNPAIQLFGRRFDKDQTEIEYLVEFMLLFVSKKKIKGLETSTSEGFPDFELIDEWNLKGGELIYYPKVHLPLKLFSFLNASKLETRHPAHIERYLEIEKDLHEKINFESVKDKNDLIELFKQLLLGFVAVGQNRTWCAYTFLPASKSLIASETMWNVTAGKQKQDLIWDEIIAQGNFSKYFNIAKHTIMVRGGEVLFLHLCNLFTMRDSNELAEISKKLGYSHTVQSLKERVDQGLKQLLRSVPALSDIVNWVESSDPDTLEATDNFSVKCGWCPKETWVESYCFAIELANICDAMIDPFEKIEMLKYCCIFEVLRSMCAQGVRKWGNMTEKDKMNGGLNGFSWIITERKCSDKSLKSAATQNLNRVQEMLHGAIRSPDFEKPQKGYKIADDQAHSLFLKLSKKINFVAPLTGPGARFVMTETLLRFFVLALIPPGQRWTLHTFKERLHTHYGIAIGGTEMEKAIRWTYPDTPFSLGQSEHDQWFEEKLRATGLLIPLSDAISLVQNPFGKNA